MAYSCPECKGNDVAVEVTATALMIPEALGGPYAEIIDTRGVYDDVSPAHCRGCGFAAVLVVFDEAQRTEEDDDAEGGTAGQ